MVGLLKSKVGVCAAEQRPVREVHVDKVEENKQYCSNGIHTGRYSLLTFFPKNLFEQFRKASNFYFLIIAVLQLVPGLSPVTPWTSLLPLIFVFSFTALKEGVEDYRRHKSDDNVNKRMARVLRDGVFVGEYWENLRVGDVVMLDSDEFSYCPCDLLLFASSEADGVVYIETKSLDGESNLKIRQSIMPGLLNMRSILRSSTRAPLETCAMPLTGGPSPPSSSLAVNALPPLLGILPPKSALRQRIPSLEEMTNTAVLPSLITRILCIVRGGRIECEVPNSKIDNFDGRFVGNGKDIALGVRQVMLRGSALRNTSWVLGTCVFTGHDTKMMQNSREPRSKRSTLEVSMNNNVIIIFILMFIVCLFSATMSGIWLERKGFHKEYLSIPSETSVPVYSFYSFFTFVILYNVLIPISLFVSLEFSKVAQAQFFNWDLEMYHAATDCPALARTSNLSEELGQVEYVFSDKTGTLTCNKMVFGKCSIAGKRYVQARASKETIGHGSAHKKVEETDEEDEWTFDAEAVRADLDIEDEHAQIMREFLCCVAVCHAVVPEVDETMEGGYRYQASSPDERTLVEAAARLGFTFTGRTTTSITIVAGGVECEYSILNVIEFNSTRKRMSVILRDPAGVIRLFTKGADDVVYARLRTGAVAYEEKTLRDLEAFASEGLRTLVFASREVDPDEYSEWAERYREASTSIHRRREKVEAVAQDMEKDLILLGASAVEDKLQEGVPECISKLSQAQIKIWVLTGDKQETAINISFACSLLNSDMDLVIINGNSAQDTVDILRAALEKEKEKERGTRTFDGGLPLPRKQPAVVIDGYTMEFVLDRNHAASVLFLEFTEKCAAVVCCRVSPLQKSDVVEMVKDFRGAVTLAVGDGANDVSMITAAHVGVGIQGQEGMQAVLASDYAIAQFKYLNRLLLVHGRWSYKRNTKLILFSFYKNFVFALTQLWFQFSCGFSGQTLIDSWYIATYNMIWTGGPIMVLAVFDQDVSAESCLRIPMLYTPGILKSEFSTKIFALWLLEGIYQSLVMYFVPYGTLLRAVRADGRSLDAQWAHGTLTYTCCILTVTLKVCLMASRWTVMLHSFVWLSLLGWFACALLYNLIPETTAYGIVQVLSSSSVASFCMIIVPTIALLPGLLYRSLERNWLNVQPFHVVQEMENLGTMEDSAEVPVDPEWQNKIVSVTRAIELISHMTKGGGSGTETFRGYQFAKDCEEDGLVFGTSSSAQVRDRAGGGAQDRDVSGGPPSPRSVAFEEVGDPSTPLASPRSSPSTSQLASSRTTVPSPLPSPLSSPRTRGGDSAGSGELPSRGVGEAGASQGSAAMGETGASQGSAAMGEAGASQGSAAMGEAGASQGSAAMGEAGAPSLPSRGVGKARASQGSAAMGEAGASTPAVGDASIISSISHPVPEEASSPVPEEASSPVPEEASSLVPEKGISLPVLEDEVSPVPEEEVSTPVPEEVSIPAEEDSTPVPEEETCAPVPDDSTPAPQEWVPVPQEEEDADDCVSPYIPPDESLSGISDD